MEILKVINHSKSVLKIAARHGWLPGARYTNLRDIKDFDEIGLIDIDWENYDFKKHSEVVAAVRPRITVARDVTKIEELPQILEQAHTLAQYAERVVIVPKDLRLAEVLEDVVPIEFNLGYSVPTKYSGTLIPARCFKRKTHLLGGRPDVQRQLASDIDVMSIDCNRFTFDAKYGYFFDGSKFCWLDNGGYDKCLNMSFESINRIWRDYK